MKKIRYTIGLLASVLLILSSCTKEGADGKDGAPGQDGNDGLPGTAGCIQCHDDSQVIESRSLQWEASTHATGGNFERNAPACAVCHTSQGFREIIGTGARETAAAISNPMPPNCYTCHRIHETYSPDDWLLVSSAPVELWISGELTDQGTANLCVNCHQPRVPNPALELGGDQITISSPYWGPHHGTQGAMRAGLGAYEVGDGYANSAHTSLVTNSCVDCHMAEAFGGQAGGHTMAIEYEFHGSPTYNFAGCVNCHPNEDNLLTLIQSTNTTVNDLLDDLRALLLNAGIIAENDRMIPGTYPMDQAGAAFNYIYVKDDKSAGIHNFKYAKTLLENSIEVFNNVK